MQVLDWNLRSALSHMKDAGPATWFVLADIICRTNAKGRCWPGTDLIARDTGYSVPAVVEARKWLQKHYAFVLVPYDKRTGAEIELPVRLNIYQLTGILVVGDEVYPYLYMTPEARQDVLALLKHENEALHRRVITHFDLQSPTPEIPAPAADALPESIVEGTIKSVQAWVEAVENPDLQALMDAEEAGKGRVRLMAWLREKAGLEPESEKHRDRIFDGLAYHLFNLPVGSDIGKNTAARIGRIKSEIITAYPKLTPEQFHQAVLWWKKNKIAPDGTPLTLPRADAKVVSFLGEFFESQKHGHNGNGAAYHSTVSERVDYVEIPS